MRYIELFPGKVYGDRFMYAVATYTNYNGETYYEFGCVYEYCGQKQYMPQGCKPFKKPEYAAQAAIDFSGISLDSYELKAIFQNCKELYN